MTWTLVGRKNDLTIGLSDTGDAIFHGWPETQRIRPAVVTSVAAISRIESASRTWTLCLPADAREIAAADIMATKAYSLAERVKTLPDRRHGSISFYSSQIDSVGITLVARPKDFCYIKRILELVAQSESLAYAIGIDFIGFPINASKSGDPTEAEFLSGMPMLIEHFNISIFTQAKDA